MLHALHTFYTRYKCYTLYTRYTLKHVTHVTHFINVTHFIHITHVTLQFAYVWLIMAVISYLEFVMEVAAKYTIIIFPRTLGVYFIRISPFPQKLPLLHRPTYRRRGVLPT